MNGDAVARVNLRRSSEIIFRLNSNGYAREKLRAHPFWLRTPKRTTKSPKGCIFSGNNFGLTGIVMINFTLLEAHSRCAFSWK